VLAPERPAGIRTACHAGHSSGRREACSNAASKPISMHPPPRSSLQQSPNYDSSPCDTERCVNIGFCIVSTREEGECMEENEKKKREKEKSCDAAAQFEVMLNLMLPIPHSTPRVPSSPLSPRNLVVDLPSGVERQSVRPSSVPALWKKGGGTPPQSAS
jgi:hypothetical protein